MKSKQESASLSPVMLSLLVCRQKVLWFDKKLPLLAPYLSAFSLLSDAIWQGYRTLSLAEGSVPFSDPHSTFYFSSQMCWVKFRAVLRYMQPTDHRLNTTSHSKGRPKYHNIYVHVHIHSYTHIYSYISAHTHIYERIRDTYTHTNAI